MLEIMFVIGFLSYLIQNAATGIISAANRELPPKAKLRMAEIDAARAAGVAAPSRYRMRDYLGDWVSDALQHARDDRREREQARRRGDDATPAPAGGESSQAPTLNTQPDADPGQQPTPAEPTGAGEAPELNTQPEPDLAPCLTPAEPAGNTRPATPDPAPRPEPATPAEPATQPSASSSPAGQPAAATARGPRYGWSCEKCGTFREGFTTEAESRADGSGHVCPNTQPSTPAAEPPAPGQRPDLRLVPPPSDEPGANNPNHGQDDRPAPNTDPGARPEQGGTTVSTTASAETTNIEAARVFLTELGEHVTDDLLNKVQTATATLAGKNIDSETLGILARIQEQGNVLASLCEEGVEHLTDYHGGMEAAVNATDEVADTDFYKHS